MWREILWIVAVALVMLNLMWMVWRSDTTPVSAGAFRPPRLARCEGGGASAKAQLKEVRAAHRV